MANLQEPRSGYLNQMANLQAPATEGVVDVPLIMMFREGPIRRPSDQAKRDLVSALTFHAFEDDGQCVVAIESDCFALAIEGYLARQRCLAFALSF